MKTIKLLKTIINSLFIGLIVLFAIGVLFFIALFFFEDYLPELLLIYKMGFNHLTWYMFLVPISYIVAYILFVVAIYFLKKCIKPLESLDFYSEIISKNLKRTGSLFILISIMIITIKLTTLLYKGSIIGSIVEEASYSVLKYVIIVLSSIDIQSIFLLIIGLFFLLFSKSFLHAKLLKEENDLTI